MNIEIKRDEVLDSHVKLLRGAIGNSFLLMNDNAHPHHAAQVTDYLEDKEIQKLNGLHILLI